MLEFLLLVHDLQLPQKGFWKITELKFKNDLVWLDRVWLVTFAYQSQRNL